VITSRTAPPSTAAIAGFGSRRQRRERLVQAPQDAGPGTDEYLRLLAHRFPSPGKSSVPLNKPKINTGSALPGTEAPGDIPPMARFLPDGSASMQ
jgi:hypothetical protein